MSSLNKVPENFILHDTGHRWHPRVLCDWTPWTCWHHHWTCRNTYYIFIPLYKLKSNDTTWHRAVSTLVRLSPLGLHLSAPSWCRMTHLLDGVHALQPTLLWWCDENLKQWFMKQIGHCFHKPFVTLTGCCWLSSRLRSWGLAPGFGRRSMPPGAWAWPCATWLGGAPVTDGCWLPAATALS